LAAFLLAAHVAQQRLVNPEKSARTFSTESVVFGMALGLRIALRKSKAYEPSTRGVFGTQRQYPSSDYLIKPLWAGPRVCHQREKSFVE
jgi:hypothetical protein